MTALTADERELLAAMLTLRQWAVSLRGASRRGAPDDEYSAYADAIDTVLDALRAALKAAK